MFVSGLSLLIVLSAVFLSLSSADVNLNEKKKEVLQFDENQRLSRNSILVQDTPYCRKKIADRWKIHDKTGEIRNIIPMDSALFQQFSDFNSTNPNMKCLAVCVDRGLSENLIRYPLPFYVYSQSIGESDDEKEGELNDWANKCKKAEVGFISYWPTEANVYWINDYGKLYQVGTLQYGERHTLWQSTYLGHVFEIHDKETDELILRHKVEHHAHVVVGHAHQVAAVNASIHSTFNFEQINAKVRQAMSHEWNRCNRVQRTFTPLGFAKGALPRDVWGSISTYQYNNRNNVFVEEWSSGGKGYFVNWWEVTPYMIGIPWNLKRYWQSRLRDMVAAWIGGEIPLENTDIYGIRRYEEGARLLTHVDREETHAVSLIVNVDQVAMREPWLVEIYDFAGRLHEVDMEPGEVVYYESARCLHGRMKHLKGKSYSNLFAHYRPVDDPKWYTRPNPEGTPDQVLSLEGCTTSSSGALDCGGVLLPYLSPSNEVVRGSNDLYSYWERIGEAEQKKVKSQLSTSSRNGEL